MTTFRILQLTDLHVFADPAATLKGIPTRQTLQDVIDFIRRHEADFDDVVVTGDHTHDELPESYQSVRQALLPWLDRLWQVPGNHDDRRELRHAFADRIAGQATGRISFTFCRGDWTCIGLDTHVPGEVPGLVGDEHLEWLDQTLSSCNSPRAALFMHHPPVDVGSVWMDRIGLRDAERLQELIRQHSAVRLVVCGHVHHEFAAQLGQAKVLTTPSTGVQFDPHGDVPTFAAEPAGCRIIEFSGTGFSTRVVRLPEITYVPSGE